MRRARWLSGVWVLVMLGVVLVHLSWIMAEEKIPVEVVYWAIGCMALGFSAAVLYGHNYCALCRNYNYFDLKNIYPAICANIFILPYALLVINNWNDWLDHDFPLALMLAIAVVLLIVIVVTLIGWIGRRPGALLAALATAGLAATVLELRFFYYTFTHHIDNWSIGWGILLILSFLVVALPGLWMAVACFFATLFTAPRLNKVGKREEALLTFSPADNHASTLNDNT